jgi:hypothetical protein
LTKKNKKTSANELLEEVVELSDAAGRPFESALGVTQVAHDVSIFPATSLSTWPTQITGRW